MFLLNFKIFRIIMHIVSNRKPIIYELFAWEILYNLLITMQVFNQFNNRVFLTAYYLSEL